MRALTRQKRIRDNMSVLWRDLYAPALEEIVRSAPWYSRAMWDVRSPMWVRRSAL